MEGKKSFGKHLKLTVLNFSCLITNPYTFLEENLSFPHHHLYCHHHPDSYLTFLLWVLLSSLTAPSGPQPYLFFGSTNHTFPMCSGYTTLFTIQPDSFSLVSLADLRFPLGFLPAFLNICLPLSSFLSCAMSSHFSRVWLCANPWTVVHQALLSMGFSRQE